MCDEIGVENGTYHTHIFIYSKNAIMFSTLEKRFYQGHFDSCRGSASQCLDYIRKEGKYADSDKKDTNLPDTFEEFGELPIEKDKAINTNEEVYQMIKDGCSNSEILEEFPEKYKDIDYMDKARQVIIREKFETVDREIDVTYIYGETGAGKSRYVHNNHDSKSLYVVTNYNHPFDNYVSQDVIVFEEFRSSIQLKDMLQYLDRYPCKLPARYQDKQACYTKVYIISNIPLYSQFTNVQNNDKSSWKAFLRRINHYYYCENRELFPREIEVE